MSRSILTVVCLLVVASVAIYAWRHVDSRGSLDAVDGESAVDVSQFSAFPGSREALESDLPTIIDFTATWCGPCKKLKPILEDIDEDGLAHVIYVDVDRHPELATAFKVSGIPYLVMVNNRQIVGTLTGFHNRSQLERAIHEAAATAL